MLQPLVGMPRNRAPSREGSEMSEIVAEEWRYNRKWKTMQLTITRRPSDISEWLWLAWGYDIFLHEIPFLKSLVLANVLVWLLL